MQKWTNTWFLLIISPDQAAESSSFPIDFPKNRVKEGSKPEINGT